MRTARLAPLLLLLLCICWTVRSECIAPISRDVARLSKLRTRFYGGAGCVGSPQVVNERFLSCVCFKRPGEGLLPPSTFELGNSTLTWYARPDGNPDVCFLTTDAGVVVQTLTEQGQCVPVPGTGASVEFVWSTGCTHAMASWILLSFALLLVMVLV